MRTTHRPRSMALAVLALAGLAAMAGCNAILGIDGDDYRDVAVEMCRCEGIELAVADCLSRVRDSLANADPDVRERWLGVFDSRACDVCGDAGIFTCLQTPPVCRVVGERCEGLLSCCGVLDEQSACIDGRCGACIPTNDPSAPGCTTGADCCGGIGRAGEVYCYEGRCIEQSPECRNSFEECSSTSQCCGVEAGAAGLTPFAVCGKDDDDPGPTRCFEACAAAEVNCPGCCARVEGAPNVEYICLDGPVTAANLESIVPLGSTLCDALCELGGDETCPSGTECTVVDLDGGVRLHICQAPG